MTDQTMNKPGEDAPMASPSESCEHHWGAHHYPGTRIYWITTCTLCRTLNVADLNEQIDELIAATKERRAEMAETATPEPEWRTSLREMMTAELTGRVPGHTTAEIVRVAVGVAAYFLLPELKKVADLEADVRALGGDPDRMVDPRDHEAAIKAMWDDVKDEAEEGKLRLQAAGSIAERHMLRMAQASLGVSSRGCPDYRVGNHDCSEACDVPAGPEVREVPAREAREGDTVTYVRRGTVDRLYHHQTGRLGVIWDDEPGAICTVHPDKPITVSRPISPLPDQPGAVGEAARLRAALAALLGVIGEDSFCACEDCEKEQAVRDQVIRDARALVGAGVDEGGKP